MTPASPQLPRILVLLATYRGEAFLDQQIASILWQVGVDAHVLARDDGSPDGTPRLLDEWVARHPDRIAIIRDDLRTGSASGNFFRLLAAAPLDGFNAVAFADQDDVWFPDKLARATAAMQADGADGYSSDLLAYDEVARKSWLVGKAGDAAELDYLFGGGSAGCTYVLTTAAARMVREVMATAGTDWPGGLSHDWAIYAACRSRRMRWVRDPQPGMLYRQHAGNDYGARTGLGGLVQRARAARNDWYRNHVSWLRRVVAMTPAETAVFASIDRGDRWWLARNARRFRRFRHDQRLLAVSFLAGLF